MIIVSNDTRSLQIKLNGAVTTNPLEWNVSFSDALQGDADDGTIGDATPVTICPGPPQQGLPAPIPNNRKVVFASVFNADTVPQVVTITYKNGSTSRTLQKVNLGVGYSLFYEEHRGWYTQDENGAQTIVEISVAGLSIGETVIGSTTNALLYVDGSNTLQQIVLGPNLSLVGNVLDAATMGGETLAQTLAIGNVTGGFNIVLTNGDTITGQSAQSVLDLGGATPSFKWTPDGGSGTTTQLSLAAGELHFYNPICQIDAQSGYYTVVHAEGVYKMTSAAIVTGVRGIQMNGSEFYSYHDTLMEFDAPLYNFTQATASRITWFDSSKNLIAGTWNFATNDILPVTTGSNIGDATHRVGTIFMSSIIDHSTNLQIKSGGVVHFTFSTTGDLTLFQAPTAAFHAVNKSYVDNLITGVIWVGADVATTGNITLSGEQTIDGFTTSGSRVFVRAQSSATDNGVYTSSAGAWTRTADASTGAQIKQLAVIVENGTTLGHTQWINTNSTITLGVTNITFTQIAGAGTYTNGTYLKLTGNVFDIDFTTFSTTQITEGSNLYFTNARAIGATLTGYVSGSGTISSADSVLSAIQKLNGNAGLSTTITDDTTTNATMYPVWVTTNSGSLPLKVSSTKMSFNPSTGIMTIQKLNSNSGNSLLNLNSAVVGGNSFEYTTDGGTGAKGQLIVDEHYGYLQTLDGAIWISTTGVQMNSSVTGAVGYLAVGATSSASTTDNSIQICTPEIYMKHTTKITLNTPLVACATLLTSDAVTVAKTLTAIALNFGTISIATAGGNVVLTVTDRYHTIFTGTLNSDLTLPDATTLLVGYRYRISNNSTGVITIKTNGGATLWTIASLTGAEVVCTNSGTSAGTWSVDYKATAATTGKVLVLTTGLTVTTNDGTIAFTNASTTLTVANTASVSGTNTGDQTTISGNAGTATALQNARLIGGVSFNGTADITVSTATNGFTISTATLTLTTGTATVAPLTFVSGTNMTTPGAGNVEFDGVQYYATIDTTSSRGAIPVEQYFHLTAAGSTISTIANYFGTTSNISLVASAYYVIDIYCYFLKTTAGTVTWTFTNSAAPTDQNINSEFSPIAGIVTGTPTATTLFGHIYNDATAAKTIVSGTLATAVNHFARFKIFLKNGTGTSLKIQATCSAGTITPGIGSFWFCRRISPNNIGAFAA